MGFPPAQQLGRAHGTMAAAARSAQRVVGGGGGGGGATMAGPARTGGACRCLSSARSTHWGIRLPRSSPPQASQYRTFLTTKPLLRANGDNNNNDTPTTTTPTKASTTTATATTAAAAAAAKRKQPRSAGAKHSLRRVAVIAQQQPVASSSGGGGASSAAKEAEEEEGVVVEGEDVEDGEQTGADGQDATIASTKTAGSRRDKRAPRTGTNTTTAVDPYNPEDITDGSNVIEAICVAESFDMERVMAILQAQGFVLDADGSGFESHEVVHGRKWWPAAAEAAAAEAAAAGTGGEKTTGRDVDVFVFESGTLVGWGLPADALDGLASRVATTAAAVDALGAGARETETLEFRRDATRETSALRGSGDVVVLGTRREVALGDRLATTRAQIAFSSGLARSVKLAVLERSFTTYFESTRRIPELLAAGGHDRDLGGLRGWLGLSPALSQKFILQKTGELLSLRAQLNHYRELTDALPDIFWDARAELGLEGYYEQVGRALDVGVRIKTLNQKMDYAQEIATVLREISSERHGSRLEWIIIVLITVEVVFELRRVWREGEE